MAERKRGNLHGPKGPKESVVLSPQFFNDTIRFLKQAPIGTVQVFLVSSKATLKRLHAKRRPENAVAGIPVGSDQVNTGNLVAWMNRLQRGQNRAIRQLVALDATALSRAG